MVRAVLAWTVLLHLHYKVISRPLFEEVVYSATLLLLQTPLSALLMEKKVALDTDESFNYGES